jgi:predicted LPLAT superfamily acyltransferase
VSDAPDLQTRSDWKSLPERGNAFGLSLVAWIATHLGRNVAWAILWPIVLFFLATGRSARNASRDYLRRVLGRRPRPAEVLRHFHTFAVCTLDRLLILCGRAQRLHVEVDLPGEVSQAIRGPGGCIMLVSHLGSFEVLRQLGENVHNIRLRIVLDRSQGPLLIGLLERVNPQFAASIIDAGRRGPELVLAVSEALGAGYSIGIMADRVNGGEATHAVRFLGGIARMPSAPWILASVLHVPVVAAFCLYNGRGQYTAHFELVSPGITVTRSERQAAIQMLAQRYADSLERRLRTAPYNWFNFYPYWTDEAASD